VEIKEVKIQVLVASTTFSRVVVPHEEQQINDP